MKLFVTRAQFAVIKNILHTDYQIFFFGSRVQGTHHPHSDLDICLKSANKIPKNIMAKIKEQFIESALPFTVDVIDYHDIDQSFKEKIEKHWAAIDEINELSD